MALARTAAQLSDRPGWVYEPKFDGWRGLLHTGAGVLRSRTGTDLGPRFPGNVDGGRQLGDVVIDGEIVALRDGRLDFPVLAQRPAARRRDGTTVFLMVFTPKLPT